MTEAIVNSMTRAERRRPDILNGSRRRRIAAGSGTQVQDVNRLMKQFRRHAAHVQNYEEIGQAWDTTYVWLAGTGRNNPACEVEIRLPPRFLWRTPRRWLNL
jgi:signal recognition particle GTPase